MTGLDTTGVPTNGGDVGFEAAAEGVALGAATAGVDCCGGA